jgi:hypothetical protein
MDGMCLLCGVLQTCAVADIRNIKVLTGGRFPSRGQPLCGTGRDEG